MSTRQTEEIRKAVRENYGKIARSDASGCCSPQSGCGSGGVAVSAGDVSERMGYSKEEMEGVPEGSNLGLGCGNPQAIARLRKGETVLDLGSGGGFDCFLAANQVGETGHVIGVDMTPDMVSKARLNSERGGYANVDFRLGEIENLPLADASVDVILSNCVINLSTDKPAVYREAYRVLKPGGRLAISDVVASAPLPDHIRNDLVMYSGCVAGAATLEELGGILTGLGFQDIRIEPKGESRDIVREWVPGSSIEDYVVSANIEAEKPQS
jgi:SAM-dependent methyltransferase